MLIYSKVWFNLTLIQLLIFLSWSTKKYIAISIIQYIFLERTPVWLFFLTKVVSLLMLRKFSTYKHDYKQILIPTQLTTCKIKVIFHRRSSLISSFFFVQSIFDSLNLQCEFWIHHFCVMYHCLHSHEQRDRQQNGSNRQNGGRLVKIVATFFWRHNFWPFHFDIDCSLIFSREDLTRWNYFTLHTGTLYRLYVIFEFSRSRLENKYWISKMNITLR